MRSLAGMRVNMWPSRLTSMPISSFVLGPNLPSDPRKEL